MPNFAHRMVCGAAGAAAVVGFVAVALAADPIEERQKVMKANGDAMKVLAAIFRKQAPFDPAVIKAKGEEIASGLAKAKDLFPEGSEKGAKETWAKPEIWKDKAAFDQGLDATVEAAKKLAAVKEEAAFAPALGALGDGCKKCHDRFQRPKE